MYAERGFSLVELLAVILVSALLLAGLTGFYLTEQRTLRHHQVAIETSHELVRQRTERPDPEILFSPNEDLSDTCSSPLRRLVRGLDRHLVMAQRPLFGEVEAVKPANNSADTRMTASNSTSENPRSAYIVNATTEDVTMRSFACATVTLIRFTSAVGVTKKVDAEPLSLTDHCKV